jgi:UDP-N-acetylmuramate dehydrogenase
MQFLENISLREFNSFHIDVKARWFASFSKADELEEIINNKPGILHFILGGGSNILFTKDFDGLIIKNEIRGITILHEDSDYVYVRAGAGESWHQFVLYCVQRNWGGVENLSLIPGNVGATPMQNIGAYGADINDVFWDLEAYHLKDKKIVTFTKNDCEFGYRESIFKRKHKDQFAILSVTFQLKKKPRFNTSYGAIEQELEKMGVKELSVKAISDAVIKIRSAKLPDPERIGNAGSFFKNPEIEIDKYQSLHSRFSDIIAYPVLGDKMKLAAGWLIEQCGPKDSVSWKGYRKGDAGCYDKQALVLVNYGDATGDEIYSLSEQILQSVKEKFGVILEREVNII